MGTPGCRSSTGVFAFPGGREAAGWYFGFEIRARSRGPPRGILAGRWFEATAIELSFDYAPSVRIGWGWGKGQREGGGRDSRERPTCIPY